VSDVVYPNKEHEKADQAARRRALTALADIVQEADYLRRKLEREDHPHVDADNAQVISGKLRDLVSNLAILGALADVREWDAADKQEES
jgi:hypothetical protein